MYETALTTLDLITNPLPAPLAPTAVDILSVILDQRVGDAIPFNPYTHIPDIGMSAYVLALTVRPGFLESLESHHVSKRLIEAATKLTRFIGSNFHEPTYLTNTHCDTVSNILYMR